jgi:geranylgeranyl diphosphate synthase type II
MTTTRLLIDRREEADFENWRTKTAARVETALEKALSKQEQEAHGRAAKLHEAMRYTLLSGGKRLRPLLALAAAEAVGGRQREALPAAMAVEAIHAYSLIHDDLPCMDDDDLRRGRPTCHKVFGEATALLAGDALLTLALELMACNGVKSLEAGRRINSAALYMTRAVGGMGMVGGQILDLAFENSKNISAEEVRFMAARKTGDLIAAALVCGGTLAGAGPSEQKTLRTMGHQAGLAFQIKDDLLNLTGDPKIMGKAVGSDAARGKSSFPAVLGEEGAEKELRALAEKALATAASFRLRGRNLHFLIKRMVDRDN